MPLADKNRIYDGYADLSRGMDGGRLANLIDKNQCSEANNVIFREGAPRNRLPITLFVPTFDNPNLEYNPDGSFKTENGVVGGSRTAFYTGLFQEASYYAPGRGQEFIMATIGGRLYQITPGSGPLGNVTEVPLDRRNKSTIPIAYHLQAGHYHITQDAESSPIIFDGSNARRAVQGEIFIGRMMAYGQGRIVLIGLDGSVNFGNIFDGKGGGDTDLLGFDESSFLNEGFPSAIPSFMGQPTAVAFVPTQDTATGVGDCLVFGERGVESFFLSIPREQWKDSQFQKTALLGAGNGGHRSVAIVNQDLWFRDPAAGWRSYRQARAQVNEWAQIPLSTEVGKWIDAETGSLLNYCSAIEFDNRLITTVTPLPNQKRLFHNGLLSLDFDILSSFGRDTQPAWDGHWGHSTLSALIGLRVTSLVKGTFGGKERAFAFFLDGSGQNQLAEINAVPVGEDTAGPIKSRLITRSMDFSPTSGMFNEKELYGGDLWVDSVESHTDIVASYRPDQIPTWSPWGSFSVDAINAPGAVLPGTIPTTTEGFKPRRSLSKPDDRGESVTKRIMRLGYEFQAKIEWTGRARIRRLRVHAQQLTEDSKANVP